MQKLHPLGHKTDKGSVSDQAKSHVELLNVHKTKSYTGYVVAKLIYASQTWMPNYETSEQL